MSRPPKDAAAVLTVHDAMGLALTEASAALAAGEVVLKERFNQQRLIPNAMEPRGAVAQWVSGMDELTIWNTSQNPHIARFLLCVTIIGIPLGVANFKLIPVSLLPLGKQIVET